MRPTTRERVAEYLEELVKCEEAAAEFYRTCAESWPEDAAFWQRLAEDEMDRAVRLLLIRERVRSTPHGVGLLRPYPPLSLQTFVMLVRKDADQVRAGTITSAAALLRAKDLEHSLIGSQPLRGLSFDDPRFAPYQREISGAWEEHQRLVADRTGLLVPEQARVA